MGPDGNDATTRACVNEIILSTLVGGKEKSALNLPCFGITGLELKIARWRSIQTCSIRISSKKLSSSQLRHYIFNQQR